MQWPPVNTEHGPGLTPTSVSGESQASSVNNLFASESVVSPVSFTQLVAKYSDTCSAIVASQLSREGRGCVA